MTEVATKIFSEVLNSFLWVAVDDRQADALNVSESYCEPMRKSVVPDADLLKNANQEPTPGYYHQLLEQSKAMTKMADQISEALKGQNSDMVEALSKLDSEIDDHYENLFRMLERDLEMLNEMAAQMETMHGEQQAAMNDERGVKTNDINPKELL